jgi:hypothetical protein
MKQDKPMKWNKGEPSKRRTVTPVTLRYTGISGEKQTGQFVWFSRENAWSLVPDGEDPDGLCLYPEDGYKILAWHN